MNNLKYLAAFSAGVIAGAVVSWKIFERRFEPVDGDVYDDYIDFATEQSDEEQDSAEDEVKIRLTKIESEKVKTDEESKQHLKNIIDDFNYSDISKNKEEVIEMEKPYAIRCEEAGEIGYEFIQLNYYDDGVLTDEMDDIVDNPENTVGLDFQKYIDDYEGDAVYIRNDAKQRDYEIFFTGEKFSDLELENLVE